MRVLASPASLKGVLSASEAAAALAEGFARRGLVAEQLPVADGGDGTAEVLQRSLGGEWRNAQVSDALGHPLETRWLALPDGTAVVESAAVIGLAPLALSELDPLRATSRGLGELILAALAERPKSLLVCLGGTATVDGGVGVREVLRSLPVPTRVACDVLSPLLGERGAARVFGPQKGATPDDVEELERRLAGLRELQPYAELPGAGAAGGLGAAFAALGAELVPGAELIRDVISLRERIAGAALVVTGEGTVDRTTLEGKAPGMVLELCRAEHTRCAVFGGRVAEHLERVELHELSGQPEYARDDLAALGERLAVDMRRTPSRAPAAG